MGRTFALWFLYCAVGAAFAAHAAGRALPPGAGAGAVFRLVAVTAFAVYGPRALAGCDLVRDGLSPRC